MYTSNHIESALKLLTNKSMGIFPDIVLNSWKELHLLFRYGWVSASVSLDRQVAAAADLPTLISHSLSLCCLTHTCSHTLCCVHRTALLGELTSGMRQGIMHASTYSVS